MTDWAAFAVGVVALTLLLLIFTRRSQRTLERARIVDSPSEGVVGRGGTGGSDGSDGSAGSGESGKVDRSELDTGEDASAPGDTTPQFEASERDDGIESDALTDDEPPTATSPRREEPVLTTGVLLANAVFSQLLALGTLVGIAWWTAVPASAFGIGGGNAALGAVGSLSVGPLDAIVAAGAGAVVGVALYVGNEAAAALGAQVGVSPSERLREAMAPGDARGWALLLVVVLPVIAVFEEALFRGALIGALAVGFAVDPWLLAVASSVAFGLGHGPQGRLGVLVTGVLGLALAAVFIVTGSLLVVIAAHYVVNALEFVVREGFGIEPV